jgi:hypothetical protein
VTAGDADEAHDLERLVIVESLHGLQARLCRYASSKAWDDFDRLFSASGQLRAYDDDGRLVFFADAPTIGHTLAERFGDGVLVVSANLDELTVHSRTRADGVWELDYLAVLTEPGADRLRIQGRGYAQQTYEGHDGTWVIRSIEFTRLLVEHGHT